MLITIGDASYAIYLVHTFVMISYGALIKMTIVGKLYQPPIEIGRAHV